jgi:hypothetical protein
MKHVRLASASLDAPVTNPFDRTEMPMSTLIASDRWLLETSWDGSSIGDVQLFKNSECDPSGNSKVYQDGKKQGQKVEPSWSWWGAIPRGKIKSYVLLFASQIRPSTVEDEPMPFELPNAQRKEESGQARKGVPSTT